MPRPLRITVPHIPLHIIDRGNNRQNIFRKQRDFAHFLGLLQRYKKELKFKLYHFCLMPNHIHFLIEPTLKDSLPKTMMRLTLAYSRYFNQEYNAVGHVWQGRYKSSLIDQDKYFLSCGLYIELNPLRAKLVKRSQDWPWSSYNLYAFGKTNPLIQKLVDIDSYYLDLSRTPYARQREYRQNTKAATQAKFLKIIRNQLDSGVFGREEYVQRMKKRFKIGLPRKRGRPRKSKS